jgi:uncharacterized cofD-like protein
MKNPLQNKKIVCLGGGIGTSNLIRGLKKYTGFITVVTSMADDGGSSGRLRKAYGIMPPGDVVSCISAMIPDNQIELSELLTYRFPGAGIKNKIIDGHKLGNLIMFAEILRTGNFYKAIDVTKRLFGVTANFYPATETRTRLSAITNDRRRIHSETTLDLAKYSQPHGLKKVYITPKHPKVNPEIAEHIMQADLIISGPGDLYTNQLPVLIVPQITQALFKSKAKKVFVINVANKPFETKGFTVYDFIQTVENHLHKFPFDIVLANDNQTVPIPHKFKYKYVSLNKELEDGRKSYLLVTGDLVKAKFPLYHDSTKLATAIANLYNK